MALLLGLRARETAQGPAEGGPQAVPTASVGRALRGRHKDPELPGICRNFYLVILAGADPAVWVL